MVSSSCKNLSRIELVYTVNANFIKKLNELDKALIPETCISYLEKCHKKECRIQFQKKANTIRRQMIFTNGKHRDEILYGLTRNEFNKKFNLADNF